MTAAVKALRMGETNVVQANRRHRTFPEGPFELKFSRRLTEQELVDFSTENGHLRIEEDKNGTLIIMPPVDFDSGVREGRAYGYLFAWWLTHKRGEVCSPSTGFKLPDTSTRASDGAWISGEKVAGLSVNDRKTFPHLVPDFVIEMRSSSDRLGKLKKKMTDTWIKNGVQLAWLIDPVAQKAYVYRQDGSLDTIDSFDHILNGEQVCQGFNLDLRDLKI